MAESVIRFAGGGLTVSPPLSFYIHLPWCVKKCPYCDFNSHAAQAIPEAAYIDALLADLEQALPDIWGRTVHTVFFGGGTPSLFSADGIDRILTGVRTLTRLLPGAEITLEANPGTVEATKFAGFRAAGVTRVSLGIQSFNPRHLQALGRIHDDVEARRAAELAATHFDTFNLDLMVALPGQTLAEALADIDTALSFEPPHLSAYHLTLEPNTPFGHTAPANLPDDDAAADMQLAVEARLIGAGMQHYETSTYARPHHASRHNLNYWQFGDYLGIGAGAHSKLSFHDRILRQMRTKHPQQYMDAVAQGAHLADTRILTRTDLPFEFMMNALRLNEGVPAALFEERTGLPLIVCAAALDKARARGLLLPGATRLQPSVHGQHFLNDLLELFLA
ncbi:MAG TPA: radical SAM family heme chaperone HemW [Thiobacillus sp.]|nr:MAG: YggW family oxidoreductase [Hydrogenophilales bacterium 28-61-11]OYZ58000.1 MAG: YggW family oxidoreductase [Hydrogenophilales bacterium 16-61-112]OZA44059.1 MAG: YggW family oxidoreductase [Hydrogenophilales bacterium 17-61-76]HQT30826.1 radical SAM family heme chaperone HemW [Thiobacillus sp.]HQT69630.1 radical SAM family heme chaperone HemW [Thiobacillus sp.]